MTKGAPFMRPVLVLIAASLALSLTGCKSACRQLSERLCECAINSTERTNCVTLAGNAEGNNPPTPADETFCKAHLNGCDCRLIDTLDGKVRCGLAKDPEASASAAIDAGQ